MPKNTMAKIDTASWQLPKIFQWLQEKGNIKSQEMYRTFNCGIGMVICVNASDADKAKAMLEKLGETVVRIGIIEHSDKESPEVQLA
jgi:phosphoribosylformylglycinamidine cyclo-ligase